MRNQSIEIRITKSGDIYVHVDNATEEEIRNYRVFLEEMIGPIKGEIRVDRPDWEKPAEIAESEEEKRKREQQLER